MAEKTLPRSTTKKNQDGKHGSFNPDNFVELQEKEVAGKTPWIAAHHFSLDGKMKRGSIGPVYLAAKTNATVIPTALEVIGGSVNLEGAKESAKTLLNRSQAIYHIGAPIKFPPLDVSIIDEVTNKKAQGARDHQRRTSGFYCHSSSPQKPRRNTSSNYQLHVTRRKKGLLF